MLGLVPTVARVTAHPIITHRCATYLSELISLLWDYSVDASNQIHPTALYTQSLNEENTITIVGLLHPSEVLFLFDCCVNSTEMVSLVLTFCHVCKNWSNWTPTVSGYWDVLIFSVLAIAKITFRDGCIHQLSPAAFEAPIIIVNLHIFKLLHFLCAMVSYYV